MRSRSIAIAALVGSLAVGASSASVATAQTPAQASFAAKAGALCQASFRATKSADAALKGRLGSAPSNGLQILVTAEMLYTNGNLSLASESALAKLRAPAGEATEWAALLDIDKVTGQVTVESSEVLGKLLLSLNAANAAVSSYDSVYQQLESAWDAGMKKLGIPGCE